jgi:translation initiation factor IF-2
MGKKVFEVAKELGVDHRELLKKCDSLNIDVRNYMSVLTDEQEQKLRGTLSATGKVVEKVQAPGVVRRRRAGKPAGDARPVGLKPRVLTPTINRAPVARPVVSATPPVAAPVVAPAAQVETPAAEPVVAAVQEVAPSKPSDVVVEIPTPAVEKPAAEAEAKEPGESATTAEVPSPAVVPKPVTSTIRKPTSSSGGAKVLGSNPIEQ